LLSKVDKTVVGDELHTTVSTLIKIGFITLNGRIYLSVADWLGGARSWGEEEALAEEDEQEEAVSLFFRTHVKGSVAQPVKDHLFRPSMCPAHDKSSITAKAGRERDCGRER
jgi:hypothetical protein